MPPSPDVNVRWTDHGHICNSWGMKVVAVPALCIAALGCSDGSGDFSTPRGADVSRLEARIELHPCIGSLDRWERNYRFAMNKRFSGLSQTILTPT